MTTTINNYDMLLSKVNEIMKINGDLQVQVMALTQRVYQLENKIPAQVIMGATEQTIKKVEIKKCKNVQCVGILKNGKQCVVASADGNTRCKRHQQQTNDDIIVINDNLRLTQNKKTSKVKKENNTCLKAGCNAERHETYTTCEAHLSVEDIKKIKSDEKAIKMEEMLCDAETHEAQKQVERKRAEQQAQRVKEITDDETKKGYNLTDPVVIENREKARRLAEDTIDKYFARIAKNNSLSKRPVLDGQSIKALCDQNIKLKQFESRQAKALIKYNERMISSIEHYLKQF